MQFTLDGQVQIPGFHHNSYRIQYAAERHLLGNVLLTSFGGIGDQVCSEPTIRYILESVKGIDFSLMTNTPELFSHLKFKDVVAVGEDPKQLAERYFIMNAYTPTNYLIWEFISHMQVHCIDYASLALLRAQIPVVSRQVKCVGDSHLPSIPVVIHPGRHWPSKTFPKDWWNQVIQALVQADVTVAIVGGKESPTQGTVDVDCFGCWDLRGTLSIKESLDVLGRADVVLTNDSSPLHMAAPGTAWIGYFATCKRPDFLTHYRRGGLSWRQENLARGGMWDIQDYFPNKMDPADAHSVSTKQLLSWLPAPEEVVSWTLHKLTDKFIG